MDEGWQSFGDLEPCEGRAVCESCASCRSCAIAARHARAEGVLEVARFTRGALVVRHAFCEVCASCGVCETCESC